MFLGTACYVLHIQGEQVLVHTLGVVVLNIMIAIQKGLDGVVELVWERVGCRRGGEGGGQCSYGFAHRSGGHVVSECDDVESQGKESVVLAFIEKPQQAAADELRAVWKKRVLVEVAWAGRAVKVVSMLLL